MHYRGNGWRGEEPTWANDIVKVIEGSLTGLDHQAVDREE